MKDLTTLAKLKFIKNRGVKITWSKLDPNVGRAEGMLSIGIVTFYTPPSLPETLNLYTNILLSDLESHIDSCLAQIKKYDDYMNSMEDNEVIIALKDAIENTKE